MPRAVALALLLGFGCDDRSAPPPAPSSSAASVAVASPADDARQMVQNRCSTCHGSSGKGDGPTAATLNPRPRDFTSKEWQKSVSDAQLRTVIVKGGAGVGKSVLMPANPDLEQRPEVVASLVQIVRAYGK